MHILSVVGARPQFIKLAPMVKAFEERNVRHTIVHTGQHYDDNLSNVFFRELNIPHPEFNLNIGSSSHGRQTGAMLAELDAVLEGQLPDWVLVYGDTNSTIAGALSASKMGIPVAHLEAGLRSFNRQMPEEQNRVVTDHLADLCLAPTTGAMGHLLREGLFARAKLVGDVMTDVLLQFKAGAYGGEAPVIAGIPRDQPFRLATLHRPENTDDPERLRQIVDAIGALDVPTVLVAHPRLRARAMSAGIGLQVGTLVVLDPLSYPGLLRVASDSIGVITDSGGLQKEAFLLRVPCTTIRAETEWTETVELGWNVLAPDPAGIRQAVERPFPPATDEAPYGDGRAASRAADAIIHYAG